MLDPFKEHIRERLKLHSLSAVRILEEIQEMGFQGNYTIVKDFVFFYVFSFNPTVL